jgi:hypothetical protein
MLELDQKVIVITEKGVVYDGFILARASGEAGAAAYKIGLEGAGITQPGQWHKACDVFVEEAAKE